MKEDHLRILWIDNLKGFILLMVCLSHLEIFKDFQDYLRPARMTTFFFLSGILFSTKRHITIVSYVKNKLHFLLFPYYKLCFLFALFPLYLYNINYTSGFVHKIQSILESADLPCYIISYITTFYSNIINSLLGFPQVGPLWFVFTLFQISCIYYIINSFCNKSKYKSLILTIFIIVSLSIGWYCNIYNISLPFKMNTMFTALFYFSIGVSLKDTINYIPQNISRNNILLLIIILVIYNLSNTSYNDFGIYSNKLGDSFSLFLITTISGIYFMIILFKMTSSYDKYNWGGLFRNIARNALIILPMHYYLKVLCDTLLLNIISYPYYLYVRLIIVTLGTILSIILFRNKLYWFIGKKKITVKDSLSLN